MGGCSAFNSPLKSKLEWLLAALNPNFGASPSEPFLSFEAFLIRSLTLSIFASLFKAILLCSVEPYLSLSTPFWFWELHSLLLSIVWLKVWGSAFTGWHILSFGLEGENCLGLKSESFRLFIEKQVARYYCLLDFSWDWASVSSRLSPPLPYFYFISCWAVVRCAVLF